MKTKKILSMFIALVTVFGFSVQINADVFDTLGHTHDEYCQHEEIESVSLFLQENMKPAIITDDNVLKRVSSIDEETSVLHISFVTPYPVAKTRIVGAESEETSELLVSYIKPNSSIKIPNELFETNCCVNMDAVAEVLNEQHTFNTSTGVCALVKQTIAAYCTNCGYGWSTYQNDISGGCETIHN